MLPHPHRITARGTILLMTILFLGIFVTVSAAFLNYLTEYIRAERTTVADTQALAIAEGALDEAAYQLNENPSYSGETNTPLGGGTFTITVTNIDSNTKRITATGYLPSNTNPTAKKTIQANVGINTSVVSFHYGVQSGAGGFVLHNSSSITGNVFSGGAVIGDGGNYVYGDVVSSGASGLVYGIHAMGSVYAHTIGDSSRATIIDKNAYYSATKTNATVMGTSYPNSPDQATVPLPISDTQITTWENQAAAGGTISSCDGSGNYTVSTNVSLGPVKIACNLIVKSSGNVLTVTGPIWVTGNITTQTSPVIKMDTSLGSQNVAIIADNPSDATGSGLITIGQNTVFQGSGSPSSFVFLVSQNKSAETGGSNVAIAMGQGTSALVAYASHGLLTLGQSVSVKEATGYKIILSNSANVTYDTGLPSTVFQSGPGGSWGFAPGTYAITP